MISTLFSRFVGSAPGYETSVAVSGFNPPPIDPPTTINYCPEDEDGPQQILYMKVQRGKIIGWEPLH